MRLTKNGQLGFGITAPTYCVQIQNPTFPRGVSVVNNFNTQVQPPFYVSFDNFIK